MSIVSFVLPPATRKVVGGLKVIYQYANHLASTGFDVRLYYKLTGENSRRLPKLPVRLARRMVVATEPRWYPLSSSVRKLVYKVPQDIEGDIVIASDVMSVESVLQCASSHKAYFIQGYENWVVPDEYVRETYCQGMTNVVVSKWLKRIVDGAMADAREKGRMTMHTLDESVYIPNGIDLGTFFSTTESDTRGNTIAMLYHTDEHKGSEVGLDVLYRLKSDIPSLRAHLFGAPRRPVGLPDWISYRQKASEYEVASIDRASSVFLCTSRQEGYGLTGLEGMACGCALVTTDCLGIREYARNEENAVICPVDDVDALAKATKELLFDTDLRRRIVRKSASTVKDFDIEESKAKFECLTRCILGDGELRVT